MLPLVLGGVGLGLLKHIAVDKPRYDRQLKLAAETARYSPWTGMAPQLPQQPDIFSAPMQFGLTGAMLGQGIANQEAAGAAKSNPWASEGMKGIGPVANPESYGGALANYYKNSPYAWGK